MLAKPAASVDLEQAAHKVRSQVARLRTELELDRPFRGERDVRRCGQVSVPDPTVIVRLQDARADQRQLLPLGLRRAVTSRELEALQEVFVSDPDASNLGPLRDPAANERATLLLDHVRARSFLAVVRVTAFAPPRLVRKPEAARSEWVPGFVLGWLVVYDRRQLEAQCSAPLRVLSDVAGAPITRRLRPDTTARLEAELARALHDAAAASLRELSSDLRWPTIPRPD